MLTFSKSVGSVKTGDLITFAINYLFNDFFSHGSKLAGVVGGGHKT